MIVPVVRLLAACCPVSLARDEDLADALAFLDSPLDAVTVARAAAGAGLLGVLLAAVLAAAPLPRQVRVAAAASALAAGCATGYGLYVVPGWLATARRTAAAGAVPDVLALAALRLRVAPAPEAAAAFAAEHARAPMDASLREHGRRARATGAAGWTEFADAWSDWAPELDRAVSLLQAAADAPPDDREPLLDRSLAVALDGTRDRMAAFAADARGPTTALYAFGVVLPLSLVGVLPAVRAAGVPLPLPVLAAAYDLLLPAGLLVAAGWLLARRPAAFPPAPVPDDHPDLEGRTRRALAAGAGAATLAGVVAHLALRPWLVPLVAPGVGLGVLAVVWARPAVQVREDVAAVEAGLPDALAVVGRQLQRGTAPEGALAAAGETLNGATGDAFAAAAGRQRRLGLTVRDALLGPESALADLPSPRLQGSAATLALAAREGPHGGALLVALAEHVDDLAAVERDARHELATVVSTLRNTACCFGPLVGGVTVALATRLDDRALAADGVRAGYPADGLGLVVGVYVLLLAAVLAGLATALDRGLDRARVLHAVGAALLASCGVYAVAVEAGVWLL